MRCPVHAVSVDFPAWLAGWHGGGRSWPAAYRDFAMATTSRATDQSPSKMTTPAQFIWAMRPVTQVFTNVPTTIAIAGRVTTDTSRWDAAYSTMAQGQVCRTKPERRRDTSPKDVLL